MFQSEENSGDDNEKVESSLEGDAWEEKSSSHNVDSENASEVEQKVTPINIYDPPLPIDPAMMPTVER